MANKSGKVCAPWYLEVVQHFSRLGSAGGWLRFLIPFAGIRPCELHRRGRAYDI